MLSGTNPASHSMEKEFGESGAGRTCGHRFSALHHETDGFLAQHQVS